MPSPVIKAGTTRTIAKMAKGPKAANRANITVTNSVVPIRDIHTKRWSPPLSGNPLNMFKR
ncbi:hypothetical protein GCM10027176_85180 [Actinoallomurus bryophytorum]